MKYLNVENVVVVKHDDGAENGGISEVLQTWLLLGSTFLKWYEDVLKDGQTTNIVNISSNNTPNDMESSSMNINEDL